MNVEITVKPTLVCPMIVRNIKDNSIGLKSLDCSIVILKSSTRSVALGWPDILELAETEEELLDYLKDVSEFTRDEKGNN